MITPTIYNALVRQPCKNMVNALASRNLGTPDIRKAMSQHERYVEALATCGLNVVVLGPDNDFPDSTFVEDTAILTSRCAVLTNPGAESRRAEVVAIEEALAPFFSQVERIESPGTLDGGDVMMAGSRCFVGLSGRTNLEGAHQLKAILGNHGIAVSTVEVDHLLHLKTGVSYLEHNRLLVVDDLALTSEFEAFDKYVVRSDERDAANAVWINGRVLVADGFPDTNRLIKDAGYKAIPLDISEFRKVDGGLSCLSLLF